MYVDDYSSIIMKSVAVTKEEKDDEESLSLEQIIDRYSDEDDETDEEKVRAEPQD